MRSPIRSRASSHERALRNVTIYWAVASVAGPSSDWVDCPSGDTGNPQPGPAIQARQRQLPVDSSPGGSVVAFHRALWMAVVPHGQLRRGFVAVAFLDRNCNCGGLLSGGHPPFRRRAEALSTHTVFDHG